MGIRIPLRHVQERPGRDAWPLLLLLLAVLVPSGLLLWVMNDTVARQSAQTRQITLEAYRGQLRLLRARTDTLWQLLAQQLQREASATANARESADQRFTRFISQQSLDGVVMLDDDGRISFPRLVSEGRLPDLDRQLLALQQLPADSPVRAARAKSLAGLLNDYRLSIPVAQRLFLMGELRRSVPDVALPTEEPLRVSLQFAERGLSIPGPGGFRQTPIPDVWALPTANRRVVGLYRATRLLGKVNEALRQADAQGVRFLAYPPDVEADPEAIAAGPSLPGWQISFVVDDASAMEAAQAKLITRLWTGFAGIAAVALLGIAAWQRLGRQLRLARLKTDLTAAVSHELRAPLASVRVLVDGLLGDETLDSIKTREYLQLIASEHARLTRVIENFLTFARIERGRERFSLVPTDPAEVVAASVQAIRERVPAGCDLRVETESNVPRIMADPDALGTALINLLDNALKFSPSEKHILIRTYVHDRSVMLAVQDNGAGIPAGEHRRIFQRFHRVDRRLARETAGVGLGLSIVALIVRAHGGQIEVSSELGAGSTFTLRLPAISGGAA